MVCWWYAVSVEPEWHVPGNSSIFHTEIDAFSVFSEIDGCPFSLVSPRILILLNPAVEYDPPVAWDGVPLRLAPSMGLVQRGVVW